MDQVFMVSATLMLKYSFTSQKPPSFTWEKIERSCARGDGQQFRPHAWAMREDGSDDARGRGQGDGGGSGGQADECGDQPSQQQQRYVGVQRNRNNCLRDAAILKDASKSAARSDHQRDVGRRRQAFIGELKDSHAVKAPHLAQGEKADQDRYQQRDVGDCPASAARDSWPCPAPPKLQPSCQSASAPPAAESSPSTCQSPARSDSRHARRTAPPSGCVRRAQSGER